MSENPPTYGLTVADDEPEIIGHLGRIAASWASADSTLVELFCRLLRDDPAGEVIYFSLNSFRSRLDVITNLVVEMMDDNDPRKEAIVTLLARLNRLNDTRNELLHCAMFRVGINGPLYRRIRRPGRKVPKREVPVKSTDLEEHGQAVTGTIMDLLMLINPKVLNAAFEFAIEQNEWPEGSPPPSPETLAQLRSDNRPLRAALTPAKETEQSPPPQPSGA